MKLRSPLFLLTYLIAITAMAQVGEPRRTISVGVNGGVSLSQISFDPTIKQAMHVGPTFGLTLRLVGEKYFKTLCALQIELNHSQLGWKEDIYSSADEPLTDTYARHAYYLQPAMLARLGWGYENRGLMGYILAGPQFGYLYRESTERGPTWTTDEEGNPDRPGGVFAQYSMPIEHKFDYGITAGAGVEWATSIGRFALDGRYYYGLSDLFGNSKRDFFSRSNLGVITIKLTYLIDIRK